MQKLSVFLSKKKAESVIMVTNDIKRFLQGTNLVNKKKTKSVHMHAIYIRIILKKKKLKWMNIQVIIIKIILKKKNTKNVNMRTNDVEIFLKSFNFLTLYFIHLTSYLWKYKKFFSSRKFGFFRQA